MLRKTIRAYRQRKGLTQKELADRTGLSVLTIFRYEAGEREPRASDIQKLCEVLNVSEAELLNGPTPNEMQVRIIVKESLDDMEEIDLSKDAPYLETVTLTPHKNAITVVFDNTKTLDDAIEAICREKDKIESARKTLFEGR
jgi:transcriptional regulator with XRE-family HTH domain